MLSFGKIYGNIFAQMKDIKDSREAAAVSDLEMATGEKNQNLPTYQSSSTSKKNQEHWRGGKGGMETTRWSGNIKGVTETLKKEQQHQGRSGNIKGGGHQLDCFSLWIAIQIKITVLSELFSVGL